MLKELEEVEGTTTVTTKKKKTKNSEVNTKTLRDDVSVQKHVDELMGVTVGNKFRGAAEDSESSSASESSSSGNSSSDSESSIDRGRRKKSSKKKRSKEKYVQRTQQRWLQRKFF